jgi:hypothetical protein
MKNFSITCTIKNEPQKLNVMFKQSSLACFYIYKNNKWIGTLCKNSDEQYILVSYSRFVISQTDVNAIGEQIDYHEKSHQCTASFRSSLKAA